MENYKEEIAKLQNQLDELKSKIEKPQFEVGKWYVLNCDWCFLVNISKIEDNNIFGYGFNYYGTRNEYIENPENAWVDIESLDSYHLATQKEVEEALIGEAVKRYGKYKIKCLHGANNESIKNIKTWKLDDKCLRYYSDSGVGCVFDNGTWATPIKTKTIDEISIDLVKRSAIGIADYLKCNKQEIIETLNNL